MWIYVKRPKWYVYIDSYVVAQKKKTSTISAGGQLHTCRINIVNLPGVREFLLAMTSDFIHDIWDVHVHGDAYVCLEMYVIDLPYILFLHLLYLFSFKKPNKSIFIYCW